MENVPCPLDNVECRYIALGECPKMDTHHLYWPKRRYKGGIERQFRELPENKAELCRAVHDEIHATEQPPHKPSRQEMLQVISEAVIQHGI